MKPFVTLIAFTLCFGQPLLAAKKSEKAEKKILADSWYVMTSADGKAAGFYNERFEEADGGRISGFQKLVQLEADHQIEENLGFFSKSDAALTPEFFNMMRTERLNKLQIDGTFTEKGALSARVRENEKERPILKRSIPKGAFLSGMFPIWLASKRDQIGKKSIPFVAVLENRYDSNFAPVSGTVNAAPEDAISKQQGLKRVRVVLDQDVSYWYLDEQLAAKRIVFEANGLVVERTTEKAAKAALESPAGTTPKPLASPPASK
jgi:hypothetical protein